MFEKLKEHLKKYVNVTEENLSLFTSKVKIVKLNVNDYWNLEGKISTHFAFVNKGLLRHFYNDDGNEKTEKFYFEQSWIGHYSSYLSKIPSRRNFQALESSELFVVSFNDLQLFYKEVPSIERFGRLYAEQLLVEAHIRNTSFLVDSAEERYLELFTQSPELFGRVPQYYIAQYLGIKPESLSRIRRRLNKKS